MWEDNRNKSGGGWLIQLPPAKSSPSIVNEAWKNIVRTNSYSFIFFVKLVFNL